MPSEGSVARGYSVPNFGGVFGMGVKTQTARNDAAPTHHQDRATGRSRPTAEIAAARKRSWLYMKAGRSRAGLAKSASRYAGKFSEDSTRQEPPAVARLPRQIGALRHAEAAQGWRMSGRSAPHC